VRQGCERAEVVATFGSLSEAAKTWLGDQSIDHDGDVVIRRLVGSDGRSRAYVNGQMVSIQALRELGEFLVEIHGQQEFQHLVKRGAQRELLDQNGGLQRLTAEVSAIYKFFRECRDNLQALTGAAANRDAHLDLLKYQLTELRAEVTDAASIEALFLEQKRISGRGRLGTAAQAALNATYEADGGSAHDLLAKAESALRHAGESDPALAQAAKLLSEAAIVTQEAASALRHYLDALDIDPARQEEVERRAAALEALARKHKVNVLELPAQLARTQQEKDSLEHAHESLTRLQQELAQITGEYRAAADKLSAARHTAAAGLGKKITRLMQTLGMAGGRFEVSVTTNEQDFAAHGSDDVEFLVSANPGQTPKSLAKVASGGELSRISLAVQVAAAAKASGLCRVFDEVDSGIGGAVAEIVGRQLRELGAGAQVLCVTHLAQVASQAHSQFRVIKQSDGKGTSTAVSGLSKSERIDEIARMLGGIDVTEKARAHARDMLSRSG